MPEPIRVLHFADLHVGMENYGRLDPATGTSSRVRDFLGRLDEVVDYALSTRPTWRSSPATPSSTEIPNPTQQREFAQRIKRLADAVPTSAPGRQPRHARHGRQGHQRRHLPRLDVPGRDRRATSPRAGWSATRARAGLPGLDALPDAQPASCAQEEHAGKSIEELELALRQRRVRRSARTWPRRRPEQRRCRALLAGHFSVAEAQLGSERTVMLGRDVAVRPRRWPTRPGTTSPWATSIGTRI